MMKTTQCMTRQFNAEVTDRRRRPISTSRHTFPDVFPRRKELTLVLTAITRVVIMMTSRHHEVVDVACFTASRLGPFNRQTVRYLVFGKTNVARLLQVC